MTTDDRKLIEELNDTIREYMDALGNSPGEKTLYTRLHRFIAEDIHTLRKPKYRDHPDEYYSSVKALAELRDYLKADVTNITHPIVQTILNTISALIAHYTDEADIARDRMHERIEDAKEEEMEYDDVDWEDE